MTASCDARGEPGNGPADRFRLCFLTIPAQKKKTKRFQLHQGVPLVLRILTGGLQSEAGFVKMNDQFDKN